MDGTDIVKNTLDSIPTPSANAKNIVALVKTSGKVTGYKLSDGQILEKEKAVDLAKRGGINGVGIAHRKGNEYLKSVPNENESDNLSNLPSVTK